MLILGIASQVGAAAPAHDYDSITSATVGVGGISTITFSNISQAYKYLQIRLNIFSTVNASDIRIRFNSDAGNNYSRFEINGSAAGITSTANNAQSYISSSITNGTTSASTVNVIDLHDYSSTNKNKSVIAVGGYHGSTLGFSTYRSGVWFNTSAITSVELSLTSGDFRENSKVALYGIVG